MSNVRDWQHSVHNLAKEKGWWEKDRNVFECLALIHSEISEALEEFRNPSMTNYYRTDEVTGKPEGAGIELADAVIRIMDLCGKLGIDLEEMIRIKHEYNATRPYRHGGKRA